MLNKQQMQHFATLASHPAYRFNSRALMGRGLFFYPLVEQIVTYRPIAKYELTYLSIAA
jgi:hypothetical protein